MRSRTYFYNQRYDDEKLENTNFLSVLHFTAEEEVEWTKAECVCARVPQLLFMHSALLINLTWFDVCYRFDEMCALHSFHFLCWWYMCFTHRHWYHFTKTFHRSWIDITNIFRYGFVNWFHLHCENETYTAYLETQLLFASLVLVISLKKLHCSFRIWFISIAPLFPLKCFT